MVVAFVDSSTGDKILREYEWNHPLPSVGDVMELHCGKQQKWVVENVEWIFAEADAEAKDDIKVNSVNVIVCREEEYVTHGEGEHRMSDPICVCGHAKSVHAPSRCLGAASTCQCGGFQPRG